MHETGTILSFIGVLIAIALAFWGGVVYQNDRLDKLLREPHRLRELAKLIRPSILLKRKGEVLRDNGVLQLVDDLRYNPEKDCITIRFLRDFEYDPIVQCVNGAVFSMKCNKIAFKTYEYTIMPFLAYSDGKLDSGEHLVFEVTLSWAPAIFEHD